MNISNLNITGQRGAIYHTPGGPGLSGHLGPTGTVGGKIYKIPNEWIDRLVKEKVSLPIHNFMVSGCYTDDIPCMEDYAREICQKYLKITDVNWWPALLGKSEIMDIVLDEEFKKL
jgi:hypothetical protein